MKNSYVPNGNRTRDRPACSAVRRLVPQDLSTHYPNHTSQLLNPTLSHLSLIQLRMAYLF